jgi:hypothetical protein
MMRRQRGVTAIGWIFLLVPVAIVGYGGLRVGPEYMNYYKVVQALKETATKLKGDDALTAQTIRSALERRFDTGYIDRPTIDEIEITKTDEGWSATADYESVVPMFGNLSLLMEFKKTVVMN